MWEPILSEMVFTQNTYSKKDLYLIQCASKIRNEDDFLHRQRESLVADAVAKATDICEEMGIASKRRIRRRRRMHGEETDDAGLALEQELRREMLDIWIHYLKRFTMFQQMSSICDRFQFLKPSELLRKDTSDENEGACILKLTSAYSEINSEELVMEVNRLWRFVKSMTERVVSTESWDAVNLLQLMAQCKLQETVPTLTIAIQIYLTLAISVT